MHMYCLACLVCLSEFEIWFLENEARATTEFDLSTKHSLVMKQKCDKYDWGCIPIGILVLFRLPYLKQYVTLKKSPYPGIFALFS